MNNLFFIQDTIAHKISFWLLGCFLIFLPFDFFYSEIILGCYAIHTFIHAGKISYKNLFSSDFFLISSLFLVGIVTGLYSNDKQESLNISSRQLALLLIPILFSVNDFALERYRIGLFKIFAYSCTLTVIYLYTDAIRTIIYFNMPANSLFSFAFMNHNFSMPIGIHATYLSMYVAFSIVIFGYQVLNEDNKSKIIFYSCCMVLLSMALIQLSSRAVLIAILVIANVIFPYFMSGKKRIRYLVLSLIISTAGFYAIFHFDAYKLRFINELKEDLSGNVAVIESTEPRIARWEATMELVMRSPVFGYGSGSEKKLLKEQYFKKRFYISYINEFNTHSEYLSFLLKAGIIGLMIYIYVLFRGFVIAWKNKDLLFAAFITLIAIVSVSENVLDLNKGIFFYSFFFSIFLLGKKKYARKQETHLKKEGNPV